MHTLCPSPNVRHFFLLQKHILGQIGQLLGLCKCKKITFNLKPLTSDHGLCPWAPLGALSRYGLALCAHVPPPPKKKNSGLGAASGYANTNVHCTFYYRAVKSISDH